MEAVQHLANLCTEQGIMVAVAESCTGGWLAKVCTDLPGSSRWFERGFVTYTNTAKQEMLGVSEQVLNQYGAVSLETVTAMAQGALSHSHADLSAAISGIAGPGGGSAEKPVGSVCFAWARTGHAPISKQMQFEGERCEVREQAVAVALQGLITQLSAHG